MFDFFKKHLGEITIALAVVALIAVAVALAPISAGIATAATYIAGFTGLGALASGGYYLGRRSGMAEEQERNHNAFDWRQL